MPQLGTVIRLTAEQERLCLNYDPFAGDRDGGIRMLSDRIVTARKRGPCCICFEDIVPQERIRRQTAIVDNRICSCRMCEPCCIAMAESWEDNGAAIEARTQVGIETVNASRETA